MHHLLILARLLPEIMGETRRVCHVFTLPRSEQRPERLAALCGTEFGPGQLELLDRPSGMPCVSCLHAVPRLRLFDGEGTDV